MSQLPVFLSLSLALDLALARSLLTCSNVAVPAIQKNEEKNKKNKEPSKGQRAKRKIYERFLYDFVYSVA